MKMPFFCLCVFFFFILGEEICLSHSLARLLLKSGPVFLTHLFPTKRFIDSTEQQKINRKQNYQTLSFTVI